MQPTVITGLDDSTRCMQEEIFGKFYIALVECDVAQSVFVDNSEVNPFPSKGFPIDE